MDPFASSDDDVVPLPSHSRLSKPRKSICESSSDDEITPAPRSTKKKSRQILDSESDSDTSQAPSTPPRHLKVSQPTPIPIKSRLRARESSRKPAAKRSKWDRVAVDDEAYSDESVASSDSDESVASSDSDDDDDGERPTNVDDFQGDKESDSDVEAATTSTATTTTTTTTPRSTSTGCTNPNPSGDADDNSRYDPISAARLHATHLCWSSPAGTSHGCYNLSTLQAIVEASAGGQLVNGKKAWLQPPIFRELMSRELLNQMLRKWGKEVVDNPCRKTMKYDGATGGLRSGGDIETQLADYLGTQLRSRQLLACPICFACARQDAMYEIEEGARKKKAVFVGDVEDEEEEGEEKSGFPLRHFEPKAADAIYSHGRAVESLDPMSLLQLHGGILQARHMCAPTVASLKQHVATFHGNVQLDLLEGSEATTGFYERCSIRRPDGLLQQWVSSLVRVRNRSWTSAMARRGLTGNSAQMRNYWQEDGAEKAAVFCHIHALVTGEIEVDVEEDEVEEVEEAFENQRQAAFDNRFCAQREAEVWEQLVGGGFGYAEAGEWDDEFIASEGSVDEWDDEEGGEGSHSSEGDRDEDSGEAVDMSEIFRFTAELVDTEVSVLMVGSVNAVTGTVVGFAKERGVCRVKVRWEKGRDKGMCVVIYDTDRGREGCYARMWGVEEEEEDGDVEVIEIYDSEGSSDDETNEMLETVARLNRRTVDEAALNSEFAERESSDDESSDEEPTVWRCEHPACCKYPNSSSERWFANEARQREHQVERGHGGRERDDEEYDGALRSTKEPPGSVFESGIDDAALLAMAADVDKSAKNRVKDGARNSLGYQEDEGGVKDFLKDLGSGN